MTGVSRSANCPLSMNTMKALCYLIGVLFPLVTFGTQTTYTVTAYCPCLQCVGLYSGGPTASGVMPKQGVTIAAPRWIPFGTVLDIRGVGRRVVQDRLALRYDNRIDIFMHSHSEAKRFGTKKLSVSSVRASDR